MPSRTVPVRLFVMLFVMLLAIAAAVGAPVKLRCDYRDNPLSIDSAQPQLSWQSNNTERNWKQSAYQILVASTPELLRAGKADVWDSGKQSSGNSIGIAYGGPELQSAKRYHWSVRVWDAQGVAASPVNPAWFETGLLTASDWKAEWISRDSSGEQTTDRAAMRWITAPGLSYLDAPPSATILLRLNFDVPAMPRNAALYLLSRVPFKATINGHEAGAKDGRFQAFDRQDITEFLTKGKNLIEVTMKTPAPPQQATAVREPAKAVLAGLLKMTRANGAIERMGSDEGWQARLEAESEWRPAAVVANLDDPDLGPNSGPLPGPAVLLRREFKIAKPVKSARLYITALGSYQAFLNGNRVGNDVLTPEYTDYKKRVTYQTYDVGALLSTGENVLGAMLGDGWFGSASSWLGIPFSFLPPPTRLLAQMRIDYSDGTHDALVSDATWKTSPAPVLHSEIYAGEVYDARLEQPGWSHTGFNDAKSDAMWQPAVISSPPTGILSAEVTSPARIVESLKPKSMSVAKNGAYIFDMGQNMVGWVKLTAAGRAGQKIRLRFAEILNPDGGIYVENLRNANQTDSFYLSGGKLETFEPHFTFHGFRYVEVTGYPGKPGLDAITGQVASSAQTLTGKLSTSSDLVNRMWNTGIRGQRGNFLSVPTDCPQRDERLGWMGDAQVFWRTGAYNADIASFGRKWLRDVTDGQSSEGAFSNTAPDMPIRRPAGNYGAPGWGDAGVIVPWTAWQQYGDVALVREQWDSMRRWMSFIQNANPDFLRRNKTGANFGDWLPAGEESARDLVGTAYWAIIARMMTEMANAQGDQTKVAEYRQVYAQIQSAFQKAFINDAGEIGTGSQTSYVLALHAGLVPEALKAKAIATLVKNIEDHNWHLTTGFLGTPHLLFVLADNGRADVAYRLLLNETFPSWGYMLSKGATTWWERWNGDTGDPAMNSFNHYAFGSVMAWVYRYAAGIDTAVDAPGFQQIILHPRTDQRMTHARGEYDSVYGKIVSDWTTAGGTLSLKVTIPANTTAKVYLPAGDHSVVTENGKQITATKEGDSFVIQTGSGSYDFQMR